MRTMEALPGIPGTVADDVAAVTWERTESGGFRAEVAGGILIALLTRDEVRRGKRLWHLSVSFRDFDGNKTRCPTWDELKHAKYSLVPANVPMVLIFPRKGAPYVNYHPTTLHLWESDKEIDL